MASTGARAMDKQPTQQVPSESPKCPRCDSSNTKFCYYNNYSLSQPRHFCKACKRYWTRGGILRNVPVGGGCRKNKKGKRSVPAINQPPSSSNPNPNPVFFGLPTNPNPNPTFDPRVSSIDTVLGFDPQPGLGFSYQTVPTNTLISNYSLFGSSTNSPTIASLLGPSLNQQKFYNNTNGDFQGLGSFEEVQMSEYMSLKVKREEGQNFQNPNYLNHLEQIHPSDSALYWNPTNFGAWIDPTNTGSSVPSLI